MKKDKKRDKRREIQHQPINFAPTNSLAGVNPTFFPKKSSEPKDSSSVIFYKVSFVKRYDNVTEKDIKMKKTYALNLIANEMNLKEKYLTMKQKGKKVESILHTDTVYYVHRGKKLIGKCSIREQRTFKGTHLIIIFRTRHRGRPRKDD
ncbi:hypothetical protein CF5_0155 [Staphylococcus phage CF5]|uniref:Uncharacterized protein n=1 Tax=Staphylococcus phage CF5 TaxID=3113739 RepID=A0AAX4J717_9CAUD|nr:hypothetical protein CF5_0155 [Staphylococcus phage CF5]